jgi:hypothetical protein
LLKRGLKAIHDEVKGKTEPYAEAALLLLGKDMAWRVAKEPPNTSLRKVGFKVFSQFDEDGIIQYLVNNVPIPNQTFIEFGVEDYAESNTRFLLVTDHWRGMVLDARSSDIRKIQRDKIYWQYDLQAKCSWITRENINDLLQSSGFGEDVGLLSIDIDGNDYWIWDAIHVVRPRIVIAEYNSLLGLHPIAVPYKENFARGEAHYSNLYYGASLGALEYLATKKGYLFLGSNVWGHNAFFVRGDIANEFRGVELKQGYVASKFRESRDRSGKLTYVRSHDRIKIIEDMPVVQVVSGKTSKIKDVWEIA